MPTLRDGDEALRVGGCELTITDAAGNVLYRNAWASSMPVTKDNVVDFAADAHSRWKIENENNNTLKTKVYSFEHNYSFEHLRALTLNMPFPSWDQRSTSCLNLERSVGRSSGCVPRGVQQGTTRRNSRSIPTSCNAAGRRAGRALAAVAPFIQRVTLQCLQNVNKLRRLHVRLSGQLLFLGSNLRLRRTP
jgi:hypothetical protein